MSRRGTVTLKGLAQELGLSPSTVSRVLNDSAGDQSRWASPETSRRILDLARERGYAKNPYAASLRTARSGLVGVVVPRLQDYVLATIYEGVDEAAVEHGYVALVANSLDDPDSHDARVRTLLDRRVDGLILGDTPIDGSTLREIERERVPFVLVNRRSPGYPSVTCNDYLGGRLAGEHLAGRGVERVFLVAGKDRMSTSIDRTAGFLEALAEHGIEVPPEHVVTGGFDAEAGEEGLRHLLDVAGVPDAVFAVNDFAAIGAMGVLAARGLSVPGDVKVIGYNDTPLAGGVGLTTIRSPMREMGRQGLEMLLQVMDGRDVQGIQLDPRLMVRTTA